MHINYAQKTYRKTQVQTANPAGLIVLLYRGALDRLRAAQHGFQSGDKERINASLKSAQDIIFELMVSVDTSVDAEFSLGLLRLYEYMNHRLVRANVENDIDMVEEVREILEELLGAWSRVTADSEKGSSGEQSVDLTI